MYLIIVIAVILPAYINAKSILGCPAGCLCDNDTFIVQCEDSKLDIIPITLNPAIQRLVLRSNKIKTVDAAFQFYRDLQYVDLSINHLVNIPPRSFLYQEKLQELHMNKNKLSSFNNKTFQGLKSLTVLNLRENFLEELPRGIFSIMPKLEELNLGQNRLSKIDEMAFEGLHNLRVLYLDDNLLSSVPTPSFPVLGNLAELHLGLNAFYSLPNEAFIGLSKLLVLDLTSEGLSTIEDQAFKGLTNMRSLNLADNKLKLIPTTQLGPLVRLEEIIIGQNEFSSIIKASFKGLSNLKRVDITGAKNLEYIEKGSFRANLNIESIVISSNPSLDNIEDGAFLGLPNLKNLVLRENALKQVSESIVSWNDLRSVDLSENPLHCDCNLLWLVNLAVTRNYTNAQCSSPLEFKGKPLKTLSGDDLGCNFGDPRQKIILTFCISAVILLGALGMFFMRYRLKVRDALNENTYDKRIISWKEQEYQKTFFEDEYTLRRHQLPIRHIPVTEL